MELVAQIRKQFGRQAKEVRAKGFIPAELYGHGTENVHLSVNKKDFLKIYNEAGESTMITVVVDKKKHSVMIQEVTTHPVTDEPLNIDFLEVRLDKKITAAVELEFVGEAPGVKEKQGVLIKSMNEIELEALPADMPSSIKVDISKLLDIGDSFYVKDLKIPLKTEMMIEPETVVVSITERVTEEEEAEMAQETDLSEIKTEGEEKKDAEPGEEKTEEKSEEKKEEEKKEE